MNILSIFLTIFVTSVANAGVLLFARMFVPDLDVTAYLTWVIGTTGVGAILVGLALTVREIRAVRTPLA